MVVFDESHRLRNPYAQQSMACRKHFTGGPLDLHCAGARPRCCEAIAGARAPFARYQFDEEACGLGPRRLRAYCKEWDESRAPA